MDDSAAPNEASFTNTMSTVCPYADHENCCPHTGNHVGDKFDTPTIHEFMTLFNTALAHSELARSLFRVHCGTRAKHKKSATRWWIENDISECSLFPNLENGNLGNWVDHLIMDGICERSASGMRRILSSPWKKTLLWLELACASLNGKPLKKGFAIMENDFDSYLRAHGLLQAMETCLSHPLTKQLRAEITKIAKVAP